MIGDYFSNLKVCVFSLHNQCINALCSNYLKSSCSWLGSFGELGELPTSKGNPESTCCCTRRWKSPAPENRSFLSECGHSHKTTLCNTSQEPIRAIDWFEVALKQLSSIRLSQSPKLRDKTAAWREFESVGIFFPPREQGFRRHWCPPRQTLRCIEPQIHLPGSKCLCVCFNCANLLLLVLVLKCLCVCLNCANLSVSQDALEVMSASQSVSQAVTDSCFSDFTDVTLVSEDTY